MTMDNAHAAGQGGTEVVPTPQAGDAAPAPQSRAEQWSDEAYRRFAVEELALQLARGSKLLADCEAVAKAVPANALESVREAARLISANAQVAKVLGQMALVERRSRVIVETIQKPDPRIAELNARFLGALESDTFRAALGQGLRQLLDARQPKPEPLAIENGT